MKKLWSIVILFGCLLLGSTISLRAQNIDSLKAELKKAKHDTTRCNILNAMIEAEGDDAVWPKYNNQLLEISERKLKSLDKLNSEYKFYQKHIADAINNVGYLAGIQGDIPKALDYYYRSLKIREEISDKKGIGTSLNNIGLIYQNQSDIQKALEYHDRSLKIREEIGDKNKIAISLNYIGAIYRSQGDITKALDYYGRSLKIREEIEDKIGIALSLNNIGLIYKNQGDIPKALEYHRRSLKIQEEIGDKSGIASSLNNIGLIYNNQGDITNALNYLGRSLKILEEIGDKSGSADLLNNLASIYQKQGDPSVTSSKEEALRAGISKALDYYGRSLKILEEIGYKEGIAFSFNNIGKIYIQQKNYPKALEFCNRSMQMSREMGYPEYIRNAAKALSKIYKATGNHKLALENYELYIQMRDSLNNIETQKATIKQQTQYEYDKKKALADKEHDLQLKQQEEKSAAEKAKQNVIIASVSVVLLLVAVFSIFLYNRFKVTQRQKAIIEIKEKETHEQKILIEEKHKEITDSINYAERIQRSFLATQSHLDGNLNPSLRGGTTKQSELTNEKIASHPTGVRNDESNYFIFFQPKDVVSGDFYWSSTLLNGNFALATADSTGHGVPGAIMSLLNITSLEKAIETETSPDKILNLTRTIIIERLKKDGSADGGKDGMDCSVCVYDFKNKKLFIAAAHNPVWIVRSSLRGGTTKQSVLTDEEIASLPSVARNDGASISSATVIEIKPDKMPVGKHDRQYIPFTLNEIDLQEGDVIYTLTDGFPDQFGGEKGKKYMSKNLRELLAANAHLPMPEQKELLQKTFSNWKGSLEQIDDVTVIGIRI